MIDTGIVIAVAVAIIALVGWAACDLHGKVAKVGQENHNLRRSGADLQHQLDATIKRLTALEAQGREAPRRRKYDNITEGELPMVFDHLDERRPEPILERRKA